MTDTATTQQEPITNQEIQAAADRIAHDLVTYALSEVRDLLGDGIGETIADDQDFGRLDSQARDIVYGLVWERLAQAGADYQRRDQVLTEGAEQLIPPWEASYDSATFTPRLLAYCNDLSAAKGAAEAWLRSQVEDATGLTWVPDPQMAVGEWDQWFQLFRDSPYDDGVSDTEIVVRRRAARTTQEG